MMKGKEKTVKKYAGALVSVLLLAGCADIEEQEEVGSDLLAPEEMEEEEQLDDGMDEAASSIEFLPQESDLADGHTVENDPFLSETAQIIEETPEDDLAEPGDVGLYYTDLTMEAEDSEEIRAVFILTNRMDDTLENIELTISFGQDENNQLINEDTVVLDEAFGILEPYTARPLYIEINPDDQAELENITEQETEFISIDYFDYDMID